MILHVVLYQPRESATPEDVAELTDALQAACREFAVIQQVRVGRTVDLGMGYMGRSTGLKYDYIAVFEFKDEVGLRVYLDHPRHRRLGELFWKVCERTQILDVDAIDPLCTDMFGRTD